MREDHRGITLIELIIAIAVSTIIMGAATFLLATAQRNYRNASASIDLQSESQIMMEQIGHWIMEGNRVESNAAKNELTIYYIPKNVDAAKLPMGVTATSDLASKRVIWISSNKKLYMKKIENIADPDHDTTTVSASDEVDETCIGEYVTDFEVEAKDAKVTLSVKLAQGIQKYEMKSEYKVRNELIEKK